MTCLLCVCLQGGTLITILGTYFKDRGVVTATNGIDTLECETPPLGSVGQVSDVYYKQDGTEIHVSQAVVCMV